jgi:hypothetical protein
LIGYIDISIFAFYIFKNILSHTIYCANISIGEVKMEMIKLLVDQLGVTESQAQDGAGAIFNMVKDKVSEDQFSNLSSAIPGLDTLMSAASQKRQNPTSSCLRPISKSSGKVPCIHPWLQWKPGSTPPKQMDRMQVLTI